DLQPEPIAGANDITKLNFHITDYLPYANLESRWNDNGKALNPYLRFHIASSQGRVSHDLLAFDPNRQKKQLAEDFDAEFQWVKKAEERAKAIQQPKPKIVVRIASKNIERTFEIGKIYNAGVVP